MATLITKKSGVAAKVPLPGDLQQGELAVNTADAIIYTKHSDNSVKKIGPNPTVGANTGLSVDSNNLLTTTYNTAMSDGVMSTVVGGAVATDAAVWKTKSIVQALDTILFPDVLPTYTVPTVSLSATQSGIKEIGSVVSQVMTATGTENDAGVFSSITVKRGASTLASTATPTGTLTTAIADQFGYVDPNNPNYYYTQAYTDNFTVVSGATSWTGEGAYAAGLAKQNNKGVFDVRASAVRSVNAPQAASTLSSSATTVTGIYPWFWGKSSTQPTAASIAATIAAGTANKVLAVSTGTISATFAASSEYVWVAHTAADTSKTVWYNTSVNTGSIGAGQFILSPVTQAVNSPDAYWSAVSYKIYISSGATDTSGAIEFRNA
jgi:hypothetical protein